MHVDSFIIRAAVHNGLAHCANLCFFSKVPGRNANHAGYATHNFCHLKIKSTNSQSQKCGLGRGPDSSFAPLPVKLSRYDGAYRGSSYRLLR